MATLDAASIGPSTAALPHLGALLQRIRITRGVSPADIAHFCGFRHQTTVERIEAGRTPRDPTVLAGYLAALSSPALVPSELALTALQAEQLAALARSQTPRNQARAEAALCTLSLRTILPESRPPALDALVRQMEQTPYPALIMDDLWFDHAINGSLCNIFSVPRERAPGTLPPRLPELFYSRWEMWHSVGIKFPQDSPLRIGYALTDSYFLPTVLQAFFEDPQTAPHLFGGHMRALLNRLRRAAMREGYDNFNRAWHQVTAFLVPERARELLRIISFRGQSLPFRLTIPAQAPITSPGGFTAHYRLAVWEPDSDHAREVAERIADPTIYYAADHDRHGQFHINSWPELSV